MKLVAFAVALLVGAPAHAGLILFDFDNDQGTPVEPVNTPVPFDQTVDGVTAHFSSPSGSVFSLKNTSTSFDVLSLFSNNFLWDNDVNRDILVISFSALLTNIVLDFATVDDHDPAGTGTPLRLQAFLNSTATPLIGQVSTSGSWFGANRYPMGTLTFESLAQPFNVVAITPPFVPQGATQFFIDDLSVTTLQQNAVPEPQSVLLVSVGLLAVAAAGRRGSVRR